MSSPPARAPPLELPGAGPQIAEPTAKSAQPCRRLQPLQWQLKHERTPPYTRWAPAAAWPRVCALRLERPVLHLPRMFLRLWVWQPTLWVVPLEGWPLPPRWLAAAAAELLGSPVQGAALRSLGAEASLLATGPLAVFLLAAAGYCIACRLVYAAQPCSGVETAAPLPETQAPPVAQPCPAG